MTKDLGETRTVTLRKPVTFAGRDWTEIALKEPTVEQFRELQQLAPVDAMITLIFLVSATPIGVLDQVGARDLRDCRQWLSACCLAVKVDPAGPETVEIVLRKPLTHAEGTLYALSLREPIGAELRKIEDLTGVEEIQTLIALVTGEPIKVIGRMGMRDYRLAEAFLIAFL